MNEMRIHTRSDRKRQTYTTIDNLFFMICNSNKMSLPDISCEPSTRSSYKSQRRHFWKTSPRNILHNTHNRDTTSDNYDCRHEYHQDSENETTFQIVDHLMNENVTKKSNICGNQTLDFEWTHTCCQFVKRFLWLRAESVISTTLALQPIQQIHWSSDSSIENGQSSNWQAAQTIESSSIAPIEAILVSAVFARITLKTVLSIVNDFRVRSINGGLGADPFMSEMNQQKPISLEHWTLNKRTNGRETRGSCHWRWRESGDVHCAWRGWHCCRIRIEVVADGSHLHGAIRSSNLLLHLPVFLQKSLKCSLHVSRHHLLLIRRLKLHAHWQKKVERRNSRKLRAVGNIRGISERRICCWEANCSGLRHGQVHWQVAVGRTRTMYWQAL